MNYRGYAIRIGGPTRDHSGKVVQVWQGEMIVFRTISTVHAERWIDEQLDGAK